MSRYCWVSFSELLYFFVGFFFNSPMPFLSRLYQYLHIFLLCIMCISLKKSNSVLGTNFRLLSVSLGLLFDNF